MNSKQRVQAAMERRPVDRIPVFMWFQPSTTKRLAGMLEIPPAKVGEAMGNDIRQAWVNNNYAMEGIVHDKEGDSHTDFWGIRWVKEGEFNQISGFPLVGADPEEVLSYEFPDSRQEELLSQMDPIVADRRDFYIGVDVSPCVFEMYWRLRGLERAVLDLAEYPELVDVMHGRCADFAVSLAEKSCVAHHPDWLWSGDDVAGQRKMVMSPKSWRRLIRPHLQRVVDVGKRYRLPVAYHCCGALRPIIGDLVEMGVEVLNPVQCNCPGMEAAELKREFGRHLTFMGGVDTQDLLPNGSVSDVRRAVARLIEDMTSDGGGYILAASHTVPPETPAENIFAMYRESGISRQEIFDRAAMIRAHG